MAYAQLATITMRLASMLGNLISATRRLAIMMYIILALAASILGAAHYFEYLPAYMGRLEMVFLYALLVVMLIGRFLEVQRWGPTTSKLAQKRPRHIRKIAARYQIKVSGKAGNTWGRITFFGGSLLLGGYLFAKTGQFIGISMPIDAAAALIISFMLVAAIPLAYVCADYVPKLAATISTNFFTGAMHVRTPGFNIDYPWTTSEDKIDQLSQRAGEVTKESKFLSRDGLHVLFKNWIVQWGPFLPLLPLNIRYSVNKDAKKNSDEATVSETVADIVENAAYQEILKRDVEGPDGLRSEGGTDAIEEAVIQALETAGVKGDKLGSTIEERNGIVVELAALGPISFDTDYEEALVARRTVVMMREDAEEMKKKLGIDGGQALDSVMIANKEKVTREIKKYEFDPSVISALKGMAQTIANAFK